VLIKLINTFVRTVIVPVGEVLSVCVTVQPLSVQLRVCEDVFHALHAVAWLSVCSQVLLPQALTQFVPLIPHAQSWSALNPVPLVAEQR
jgi:hypothetical protein